MGLYEIIIIIGQFLYEIQPNLLIYSIFS